MRTQHSFFTNVFLVVLALAAMTGCGRSYERDVARVHGTVKCDGELLKEGIVIFTPVEVEDEDAKSEKDFAKGARGEIQPDGTYTLSTYREGDGAVVGVHEVRVMQLDPEDDDTPVTNNGFACSQEIMKFTVESGKNEINIEMSMEKKKAR